MSRGPAKRTGLASSRDRFHERAARVRRRPWRLAGWLAVVMAVVAAMVWVVAFSPLLVVRQVEVVGVPADEVAAITRLAAIPMGEPLVRVDEDAVVERRCSW
jgi:cell division protein FtsQ